MLTFWSLKLQRLYKAQETWNDDMKKGQITAYVSLNLPGVGDVWGELLVVDWIAVETKKILKTCKLWLTLSMGM